MNGTNHRLPCRCKIFQSLMENNLCYAYCFSFGGFDVVEYYQLSDEHYLVDGATGCGNQLNFSHIVTCNLVLDSLTYWLETMGVDGFRFDLAPVLGRTPSSHEREDWHKQKQFFPKHPLLENIEQLGKKYDAEMIAREAAERVEIDGKVIEPGELVFLYLASANRDPEQFPDPKSS